MSVSKQEILASLATIEAQSPAYLGDMPVDDDVARDIFASAMAPLSASPDFENAELDCREISLLATLTHVMLEAACLRYRLQASVQAASFETRCLLGKLSAH
jgi:hypothetical protein